MGYDSAMSNTVDGPNVEPAYPVSSVDNALTLLSALRTQRTLRVTDAARQLGVARSTAHRLLSMLAHHDFVIQDDLSKAYMMGPELVRLGLAAVRNTDIRTVARPALEALRDTVQETVHLATLRGTSVLYLDCVESARFVRVGSRVGSLVPAANSAAGRALLSVAPPALLDELSQLTRTEAASFEVAAVEGDLAEARERGYAISRAEPDLVAVGAVIQDPTNAYSAAVSIGAPTSRAGQDEIDFFARELLACTHRIAEALRLPVD